MKIILFGKRDPNKTKEKRLKIKERMHTWESGNTFIVISAFYDRRLKGRKNQLLMTLIC